MKIALTISLLLFASSSFSQNELMDIDGALKISNTSNLSPETGTIRYNPDTNDFEGYNGQWVSLVVGPFNDGHQVRDIDGNIYNTVDISGVVWMRENLKTTRYKNGIHIPEITSGSDWIASTEGAWCWYDNNERFDEIHGKLYNWYAVDNSNGLCPEGWRVANNDDINGLFLALISDIGAAMKEKGLDNWEAPNSGTNNRSGFSARGSGLRSSTLGAYTFFMEKFSFWSSNSDQGDPTLADRFILEHDSSDATLQAISKKLGSSVRCVKN